MRTDILAGRYRDPYELDIFSQDNLDLFSEDVAVLSESLNENKKRKGCSDEDEQNNYVDRRKTGNPQRELVDVNIGVQPWDDDQMMKWPDFQAEAFEDALEDFRQRPESNTGYENEALNKLMIERLGKELADKIIQNKLFKNKSRKASAHRRFLKRLKKIDG